MAEMVNHAHNPKPLPERRFRAFLKQGKRFQVKIPFNYDRHSVLTDLKTIDGSRSRWQLALTNPIIVWMRSGKQRQKRN